MPHPPRHVRFRAIAVIALLVAASVGCSARAASVTLGIALDTDANAATGCLVATADGNATGIEQLVTVGIVTSSSGATVDHVAIATCNAGSMGAAQPQDGGGWPVGIGNGTGGSSVVELAVPLSALPPGATMRAWVVADDGAGGRDATGPFTITLRADAPAPPPSIPVPLSPWLALPLALLVLAALRFGGPRLRGHAAMLVLCAIVAASGLAWATSVLRDGNVGDWLGIAPAITDPAGDAPPNADLRAVFHQHDATSLYLRIDADIRRDAGGGGNVAPIVHAGASQAITLPATAALAGSASDDGLPNPPSALALTWSVDSGPGTGVLFADAHAAQTVATFVAPGTYVLRLTADDGALSSSGTTTVVVGDVGPQIQAIADRTITPGDHYLQQLQAQDANVNAVLSFALLASPPGAALAPPSLVDWTPTAAQLGMHTFTAQVRDGAGRTAATTFHVTVARQNRPPVLASQPDATLPMGATLARILNASDPDGDTLTFDLLDAPPGVTLTGNRLSWDTASVAAGRYTIKVRVRDGEGQSDARTFVVTLRDSVAPVAIDDHYEVHVGASLAVAAPGLLANDVAAGGASLLARKLTDPAIGTLSAFGADGSFTFVAPQALPPQPSPTPKALWQGYLPDNIGYGLAADINKDGGADLVTSSFGVPVAFDGKTGARVWTGWDTSETSLGRNCAQYLFGTDFALGDVDGSGDITLIQGTNCDNRYSTGAATRLIALDTTPARAVNAQARVKWVSARLDEKIPVPPSPGAPPVDTYVLDSGGYGLASYATPTLARLTANGGVKVLTRILVSSTDFPYDSDADGSRDKYAACRAATGKATDEGKGCKVTIIVDAATGLKEAALTAPNPLDEVETVEREPMRETAPVVADLDGDGQVEIVSGSDVFRYSGGQWTLAWQAAFPAAERFYDPMAVAVADLDGDGTAEVILQAAWAQNGGQHGFLVYRHDGVLLHSFTVPTWDLGLLSIADVDGDGLPEILITARGIVYAYHPDGSLLWATLVPDDDLALYPGDDPDVRHWPTAPGERTATGSVAVYDLDLDGAPEVIVPGRHRLVILDGRTGRVRDSAHNNGLATNHVVAMVVDVDGDGHADILDAAGNSGCAGCPSTNLLAFRGADNNWAPAPKVFNQLNYNPWAIDDAGAIAYDGGVHRSFRQPRQLGTAVDPRTRDTATFTYTASDGGIESAPATVRVQVVPPNSPPVITSTPPTALLDLPQPPDNAYPSFVYQVAAYDPDPGDHVHYELVYSTVDTAYFAQATVDATTGVMRMYTGPCGSFGGPCNFGLMFFIVAAVDSQGARTEQAFTIDVISQTRTVPDVVGQPASAARTTIAAAELTPRTVEVFDTRPAGIVVAQDPAAGTPNVPRSATVVLSVSKGPQPVVMPDVVGQALAAATQQLSALGLAVSATTTSSSTVAAGIVIAQLPAFGTTIVPSPAHPAALTVSSGPPLTGAISKIVIEPGATTRVTGDDIVYRAVAVLADGTARDITLAAIWTSSATTAATITGPGAVHATHAGTTSIAATLDGASAASPLAVVAPVAEGTDPLAAITAPVDGAGVTGPVDVIGTASDDHFLRYELAYAADGDADFTLIREGTTPVTGATLGTFDPTLLLNGAYTLRLTVYDRGGNAATAMASVTVEGNRKVGAFTLAYTDLTVPLAGIPIQITRTYDSRDKGKGDFGIGWRLGLKAVRVATTRAPGDGWEVIKNGLNYELVSPQSRYVTVTLPNGRVETFDLRITPSQSPLVPFQTVRASVAPRPGTQGSLQILGNTDLLIVDPQPGRVTLVDDGTLESFQPERFRYTQRDGTEFVVSRTRGVESARDANGNTITVTPTGISHSTGVAVVFARDAQDRITGITDPSGAALHYAYSADGDLAAATDRTGGTTRYFYDRLHGIVRIEDPLGRTATRTEYDDAGRVTSITDALGNTIQFRHDLDGRQEQIEDALGHISIVTYDERGNVTANTDALGRTTLSAFDARDRLLSRTDALGHTRRFEYDDSDQLTRSVDPLGRATTYAYDSRGNVTLVVDPKGNRTAWQYDANGNRTSVTDALGRTTNYAVATNGNLLSATTSDGIVSRAEYAPNGLRSVITAPDGHVTSFRYDANGNVVAQEDAGGGGGLFTYDANGRIIGNSVGTLSRSLAYDASGAVSSVQTASGQRMGVTTDAAGRLTGITNAAGAVLAGQSYDAAGNLLETVDVAGNRTSRSYDAANQLRAITTPTGAVERRSYDDAGRLTRITDARGYSTAFTYDEAGHRLSRTDALGGMARWTYDANGNVTSVIDALGRKTTYDYDALDRLARTVFADGTEESATYDEGGRVVRRVDTAGNALRNGYDDAGRLVSVTDALGNVVTQGFDDPSGLPTRIVDANGHATRYGYDAAGRRISTQFPDGSAETATYDATGRLLTTTNAAGATSTWQYDGHGRRSSLATSDGIHESYSYSEDGLPTSMTDARGVTTFDYDPLTRSPARVTEPDGNYVRYEYDAAGFRTAVAFGKAGAERVLRYAYDALGRIETVTDQEGNVTRQGFDAAGNRISVRHPNGVTTTRTFDARDRVQTVTHRAASGAILLQETYSRNARGDTVRIDRNDGSRVDFAHDAMGRVTAETRFAAGGALSATLAFAYDPAGNRILGGSPATPATYVYDSNNRVLSGAGITYTYDASGRRTESRWTSGGIAKTLRYRWDSRDRMTGFDDAAGAAWSYGYDWTGLRTARSGPGGASTWLVDRDHPSGFAQVLSRSGQGHEETFDWTTDLAGAREDSQVRIPLVNALGSVRALADSAGVVVDTLDYGAVGNPLDGAANSIATHRYAGEMFDAESGLTYLRARYYDPVTGTFLSGDSRHGSIEQPMSLNRYAYALGNPVDLKDPGGHETLVELNFASAQSLQLQGQNVLRARRALEQTKDVAYDAARVTGGIMGLEAVMEDLAGDHLTVLYWFGGGRATAEVLDAIPGGGVVNAGVNVTAALLMGKTATDMLGGKQVRLVIEGVGILLADSLSDAASQAKGDTSYENACAARPQEAIAWAIKPNTIELCSRIVFMPWVPSPRTLSDPNIGSIPGILLHEYTHLSLGTKDYGYGCQPQTITATLRASIPGGELRHADIYRCWAEDVAIGWSAGRIGF